jgi:putative CocE/NonD family hydrolase
MHRTFLSLTIALLAAAPAFSQPAPLSGFSDEGTFVFFVNEERVVTHTFQWKTDGTFESKTVISVAGQTTESTLTITPDAEGRWIAAMVESGAGKLVLKRDGKDVTMTFRDKPTTLHMKEDMLTFQGTSLALISQALRRYDAAKGGKQEFPCLVLGGSGITVTVERKAAVERTVGARDLSLTEWVYALPGIDIIVLADKDGRIYSGEVPVQHATFVREGYEALRKPPVEDPLVSAAKYEVKVDSNVMLPMRDGVKLATDIYHPVGVEKAPVVLVRTPYKKEMSELQGRYYARRGYAFAIQDTRGRFGSQGQWEPFVNEAKDGYDTIEWLAAQPWSNGKVGMIGGSYLGWVQWFAASQHPPHLTTMIPNVSPPDPFHNIPYENGVLFLTGSLVWATLVETEATADISGATLVNALDKKFGKLLNSLPVIDLDKAVLGKENRYWRNWIAHPSAQDKYWADTMFLDKLKDVNIPVFHQSGWYDGDGIGTKLNYLKMASYGHANQKLTIGPWPHSDSASRRIGDHDFGPQAIIDLQRDYLRWFDFWLKGADSGIMKEPLVSIFTMGSNKWLQGPKYPLPETRFEKLYLTSGGHANTSKGDGKLSFTPPTAVTPPDRYVYDPGDPTPDPSFLERTAEEEKIARPQAELKKEAEAQRDKVTAARQDILVYVTEPFEKPYTIAGPVSAVIYASSSTRDTDWFVYLMEVDEKGKFWPLIAASAGKVRARYRNSIDKAEFLKPGRIYAYTIDLWHTGMTIQPGHRLRIEVASAQFPMFARNLNTGGNNETETKFVAAKQAIYHDAKHPSHVLLPMIPEK